jgi:hypothetical protein
MTSLLQDIVALIAITNPLGALPVFLAITERLAPAQRSRAGLGAAFAVTIILAVAALAGKPVLAAFGISMPALQAAGGLVVLLMGLEMLRGAPTRVQHDQEPQSAADQVLVPLAMPLLAGPGAIATVITLASRTAAWRGLVPRGQGVEPLLGLARRTGVFRVLVDAIGGAVELGSAGLDQIDETGLESGAPHVSVQAAQGPEPLRRDLAVVDALFHRVLLVISW